MSTARKRVASSGEPLITVIVAVFNGAQTLQRCIDSIAEQTYPYKELIVMDGGSTDGTVEILKVNNDKIAYWESKPDRGIAHAWNKALTQTTGDWILFLGADDRLADHDVFSRMAPVLRANYDEYLVFGQIMLCGGDWDGTPVGTKWDWKRFRRRMTIPHPAAFHARRLFDEWGYYDETKRIASDYELLLRLKKRLSPVFVEEMITFMSAEGLSMNNKRRVFAEAREAQIKHKVASSLLINLWYLYFLIRILYRERLLNQGRR